MPFWRTKCALLEGKRPCFARRPCRAYAKAGSGRSSCRPAVAAYPHIGRCDAACFLLYVGLVSAWFFAGIEVFARKKRAEICRYSTERRLGHGCTPWIKPDDACWPFSVYAVLLACAAGMITPCLRGPIRAAADSCRAAPRSFRAMPSAANCRRADCRAAGSGRRGRRQQRSHAAVRAD